MHQTLKRVSSRFSSYSKKVKPKSVFTWLLVALAAVAAFYCLGSVKNWLTSLGLVKSPGEKAYDKNVDTGRKDINESARSSLNDQYLKQKSTKTDQEWVVIADQIYKDLKIKNEKDPDDAGYQIARVQNDTDCYKLIDAFGNRSIYFFGIPYQAMTLPQFVVSELSRERIDKVNANLKGKGIKFRW